MNTSAMEQKIKKNLFVWGSVVASFESTVEKEELGNVGDCYAAALLAFDAMSPESRAEWVAALRYGATTKRSGTVAERALMQYITQFAADAKLNPGAFATQDSPPAGLLPALKKDVDAALDRLVGEEALTSPIPPQRAADPAAPKAPRGQKKR